MKLAAGAVVAMLLAGSGIGVAQPASALPMLGANGKPLEFDVVSIREDKSISDPRTNPLVFGMTPDGYRLKGLSVIFPISTAYIPTDAGDAAVFNPGQIVGLPGSMLTTRYDIEAKVAAADLPRWKDPAQRRPMLRAMLQTMLAERFKIVVHREYRQEPMYELTLAKGGPKFKPTNAGALGEFQQKHPGAEVYADIGGTMVTFTPEATGDFGVTMATFSKLLTKMAGRPVEDKTGLTGKFDIVYRPPPPQAPGAVPDDSDDVQAVMEELGLKLVPAKGPVEYLVIDHIEMPSQN